MACIACLAVGSGGGNEVVIRNVSVRYAFRSLFRHPRRTLLSMLGAAIGCTMAIMAAAWVGAGADMQLRAATESGAGHLRIVHAEWAETRENTLRLDAPERTLEMVSRMPEVTIATPRARANALLAFGNRMAGVEIAGVDPVAEQASNRIVYRSRIHGRYLRAGDSSVAVIGKALAKRLDVELDDDLYVTLAGKDEISGAMFRIVGILETGSKDLDVAICHVMLEDLSRATGLHGIGEVVLMLERNDQAETVRERLSTQLSRGNDVVTWKEVHLEIAANVEGDTAFTRILVSIIIVVVSLGIAGAQLTAVLERRREFAVLSALGMKDLQVVSLLLLEAVMIGVGGAIGAVLMGGAFAHWLATTGVNLTAMMGGESSFGGVMLDPVMKGPFGLWVVWYGLGISVFSTVFATLYPAWFAVRAAPADALRKV